MPFGLFATKCPSGISVSPATTQTLCLNGTANALKATVTISGNGGSSNITYQWYYNTNNSNNVSGATTTVGSATNTNTGTTINTLASGNISTSSAGSRWYFCVVTSTSGNCSYVSYSTSTVEIDVSFIPTITFTETSGTTNNDGIICNGDAVTLTANPTSGMTYSWAAPISATGNNKSVSPANTTAYTVTVTNSTSHCSAVASASVTVSSLTSATITVIENSGTGSNDGTICRGDNVTLTANPATGMSYAWAAPISAGGNNQVVSPIGDQSYTVTVTDGTTGCSASATATITVNSLPNSVVTRTSPAGPQFSGADVECQVTASGGTTPYSYSWSATNPNGSYTLSPSTGGNTTTFGTTVTNSLAYNVNPFPYLSTISCIVTDMNGCTATGSQTSNIHPNIQAPVGSVYVCMGTATSVYTTTMGTMPYNSTCDLGADGYCSYEWTLESVPTGTTVGSISSSGTPNNTATITWDPGFTGTAKIGVRAIGTGISGRTQNSAFEYTNVTITNAPTSVISGTGTICDGYSSSNINITFSGTSPWSFTYTDGTNPVTVNSITANPYYLSLSPSTTSSYTISALSDAACAAPPANISGSGTITVNAKPTSVISGTQTICSGATSGNISIALTGTSPWDITYNDGTTSTTINGNTANPYTFTVSPSSTKTYTVTALSDLNCTAQAGDKTGSATVTVDQLPLAIAGGSQTICQTGSATVSGASAPNGGTISWTHNGTGTLSNTTTLTPTYTPTAADAGNTVTLTMTVTSNNTCGSATALAYYSVSVIAAPTATAGGSSDICYSSGGTATVSGATAANGTIAWAENGSGSITSGATTLTPTYTAAAGDVGQTRTLTMTVSNGVCHDAIAYYSVNVYAMPTATAGGSKTICQTGAATVSGASSSNGTRLWTHNGTGILSNATSLTPTYTANAGDAGHAVTLTMTVTNGSCTASAIYTVNVDPLPTATAAGSTTVCYSSGTTVTVSGANATNGTIYWTENGYGSISSSSRTTLTPVYTLNSNDVERTVTLTMTVTSNNTCGSATASDTYLIYVKGTPTTSNASTDQTNSATCGLTSVTLNGNSPSRGTGMWSIVSGTGGSFFDATNRATTFSGVAGNSYTLRWTISNNPCTASTDDMNVTFNLNPDVAMAADYCYGGGKVQVIGTSSITPATYIWSTGGTGNSILVDEAGAYVVTASVTSTGCTASGVISIAQELTTNGDFSLGVTGFTTDPQYTNHQAYYTGTVTSGLYPEGLYAVNTNAYSGGSNYNNPYGYHPLFFAHDHTTGTGNFMMVNGNAPTNGVLAVVWQEGPITVLPNTDYYFSAWAMSLNNYSPYASLQFSINGTQVGTTDVLGAGPSSNSGVSLSNWSRFYGTWNSGSNTTVTVSIVDLQTAASGNDFGLDDISFGTLSTFINLTSAPGTDAQTVCAGVPLTEITYSVGGGLDPPTMTGLPSGVTTLFNGITLTIKGTPTVAGTYTYTATTSGSCAQATATGTITVNPLPVPVIAYTDNSGTTVNDGTICKGDPVTLTATPSSGMNYLWSSIGSTADHIDVSPGSTSLYSVTLTNSITNCSATISAPVTVNAIPAATITVTETSGTTNNDGIVCTGASVTLTGNPTTGMNYAWSAPLSATGNNQNITSASVTTPYDVTVTDATSACSATATKTITVNPLPVQTTVLADCMFVDSLHLLTLVDSNIVLVSVSDGTAPYAFTPPSSDKLRLAISSTQMAYTAPADNTSHSYMVKDALGCSSSTSVTTSNGNPTNIPYTATIGNESANCYVKNFNKWITFRDSGNNAILSIFDNDQDLGVVTVTVYKEGSEPEVLQTGTGSNCQGFYSAALERHFVITSTASQPFASDVKVRLYFSDAELQSLETASFANNALSGPGDCRNVDDVSSINDLYVTKYDDPNSGNPTVDGSFNNNLSAAAGGIYKVYGNTTSQPIQPDGPLVKKQAGFASYFPNAQLGNHYVQLSVRNFSEFWLHGSNNATALPVKMLYLEANAINNQSIKLSWATALEINNDGFQVERSTDGNNWTPIGWVEGHDNATVQNDYDYNDANVLTNVRYYYRLKQLDNDGQYEYTDIVTAMLYGEVQLSVKDFVPNPTTDKTSLIITTSTEQKVSVDMYDILGQKVYSSSSQLNVGANLLTFDTRNFASGTYTVIVTANQLFARKLVITK